MPVCAKLESEIAELDEADRAEMLESSGLAEPALTVLARAAYRVLGLRSYFTAGEMEVRAWTFPAGATAPQAAGVIHTDFEKGFIRAEVYTLPDLETYKSEKELRAAGKLRIEGKDVHHAGRRHLPLPGRQLSESRSALDLYPGIRRPATASRSGPCPASPTRR